MSKSVTQSDLNVPMDVPSIIKDAENVRLFPRPNAGTPEPTRTADLRFRKPMLYPLSYEGVVREL